MVRKIIRMNISRAMRFLDIIRSGVLKERSLRAVKDALQRWLLMRVLTTNLDNIYSIDNAAEMRRLIRSNGTPNRGTYHPTYRWWKTQQTGMARLPHHITGQMVGSIDIDIINDILIFYIPMTATERTRISQGVDRFGNIQTNISWVNFGPIHERRKSILKATVVFAWNDIMSRIGTIYEQGALTA